jgi:flagellin-like hook-associated protein FlgL
MSQLSDTDFTTAITKFQLLQTSLQATLETAAKTLQLSLIDFIA